MRHGSLFSGMGGFDLAAQWAGWENVFHCEWKEFNQKILKYYWPEAITYNDITKSDFTIHRGKIDVLTGGFPCQPYSVAGKRKGKEDDRHLWPEMLRAIREIQPSWVVGENVGGLVSWNGGMVFDEVQADLEAEGYEVQPFILPACAINAPHRRDRIWFIAYSNFKQREWEERGVQSIIKNGSIEANTNRTTTNSKSQGGERLPLGKNEESTFNGINGENGNVTDPQRIGQPRQRRPERQVRSESFGEGKASWSDNDGRWPTQSPLCDGNDGFSSNTHTTTISEQRNNMDRNLVALNCLNEGRLTVDFELGKIYSLKQRGKEGQPIELSGCDCNGYIVHGIRYNGFKIQLRAHQVVWIAANGDYDKSSLMIDHINRNKKDNRLSNLRLVDAQGNRDNATPYKGKISDEEKDIMAWLNKEDGIPIREIAEDYGISKSRVHQIIQDHNGIYGITFPKWRNESIMSGGNAIVPQVALEIFKVINQME